MEDGAPAAGGEGGHRNSSGGHSGPRSSRFVKGTSTPKPANVDGSGIISMFKHPLSVLLVCCPLGLASSVFHWGDVSTFCLNFFALIPLAKILGDATEELAAGLRNDMLAGLLNATFGNAVEVVIMMQTLRAGLIGVVKASLLGSVLSNLLLVLGMSFFFGGLMSGGKKKRKEPVQRTSMRLSSRQSLTFAGSEPDAPHEAIGLQEETYTELIGEKVQTFSVLTALVNTSMLLLSCLSLCLVTVFYTEVHGNESVEDVEDVILPVSRICSVIIMIAYGAYIFFQLVTHREAMAEDNDDGGDGSEEEGPALSICEAVMVMFVVTLVVAFSSEMLVNSLEGVVEHVGISPHFIGIILLPIVGNACEHASAIRFAVMDKPGLSIGIAVGSSTQISLFVVPFSVLAGWVLDKPMDLNFGQLNTTLMSISVIVVLSVVVDGTANWLQGYLLMSAYVVAAVLYWHLPNDGSAL